MATKRTPLASDTYRKELRAVANGEDSGPHPIPTDEQIDAVLAGLDDGTDLPGEQTPAAGSEES